MGSCYYDLFPSEAILNLFGESIIGNRGIIENTGKQHFSDRNKTEYIIWVSLSLLEKVSFDITDKRDCKYIIENNTSLTQIY